MMMPDALLIQGAVRIKRDAMFRMFQTEVPSVSRQESPYSSGGKIATDRMSLSRGDMRAQQRCGTGAQKSAAVSF